MGADLEIDYAALDRAATAMATAQESIETARSAFTSAHQLSDGDFTDKGEKMYGEYDEQREEMLTFLEHTHSGYGQLGHAFAVAAQVMRNQDRKLASDASKKGGH
ncbi:hypothetical protein [Nocardioides acrostichi]|uniref:Uncharacterized protein n=1 Tax=Nocardioides acrostichi TaxID=2784339 RepID=A0A930YAM2_9ACTN|nr:hypothetical protein [Nocardioides acrostichi]MBF4161543.1 hypothetical protein [Nocardioides acrostichi]